jgi:hypothetical protein
MRRKVRPDAQNLYADWRRTQYLPFVTAINVKKT